MTQFESDLPKAQSPEVGVDAVVANWSEHFALSLQMALTRYEIERLRLSGQSNVTVEHGVRLDGRTIEIGGYERIFRWWDQKGRVVEEIDTEVPCQLPFATGTEVKVLAFDYGLPPKDGQLLSVIRSMRTTAKVLPTEPSDEAWHDYDGSQYVPRLMLNEKLDLPTGHVVMVSPAEQEKKYVGRQLELLEDGIDNHPLYGVPAQRFFAGEFTPAPLAEDIKAPDDLDEFQAEAYIRAMDIENNPILLIHGPPGSGKSTATTEIIKGHLDADRKVLLLSGSNKGSQVPALMLQKRMHRRQALSKTFVAGNSSELIAPELRKCRIKRDFPPFPDAKLTAIKALPDWQIRHYLETGRMAEDIHEAEALSGSIDDAMSTSEIKIQKVSEFREYLADMALKEFNEAVSQAKEALTSNLETGGLVVSTFGTAVSDEILDAQDFDVLIVDEATRMEMPDAIYALQKAGAQIIFVGDPLQLGNLPPEQDLHQQMKSDLASNLSRAGQTIDFATAEKLGQQAATAWESPFAQLVLEAENPAEELPYVLLRYNRRSRSNIVNILSELIYDGKMMVDESTVEFDEPGVVKWFDTAKLEAATEKTAGTSKINSAEADLIANQVVSMLRAGTHKPEDIGVIATYKSQADLILKRVAKLLRYSPAAHEQAWYTQLKVANSINTVDAFQGDERKVILVSMTRSNDEGEVGFLEEERRIGVAIGRAQEELYIYGNSQTLTSGDDESSQFFGKLVDLVEVNGERTAVSTEALEAVKMPRRKRSKRNLRREKAAA